MKIVIVNGSARIGRKSYWVSKYLYELLSQAEGIDCQLLDVKEYDFPIMEERMKYLESVPDEMKKFSHYLMEANGIILVTPEYNGSYSGALKNTLDYFKPEYVKKAFALVTVSAGKLGGANAMQHLQAWVLHVKGVVSPFKLFVGEVEEKFDDDGQLTDPSFPVKVQPFLKEFFWLTHALK